MIRNAGTQSSTSRMIHATIAWALFPTLAATALFTESRPRIKFRSIWSSRFNVLTRRLIAFLIICQSHHNWPSPFTAERELTRAHFWSWNPLRLIQKAVKTQNKSLAKTDTTISSRLGPIPSGAKEMIRRRQISHRSSFPSNLQEQNRKMTTKKDHFFRD